MNQMLEITYYYHSGFSCAIGDVLCIFDYWTGEHGELPEQKRITPEKLAAYREIYVFVSHSHQDHVEPEVFTWHRQAPVAYVVSYEMPIGTRGRRMSPGDRLTLSEHVEVTAYDSTDLGVSFLLNIDGIRVFHAGDLNFWHWREESTNQEIAEAEQSFHEAVKPLEGQTIDVAFFPVDPRQGRLFDAGANYFIMAVKPRLLIPMHFFGRVEVAAEFARRARCRQTEVLAMTRPGEKLRLEFDDDGFMTVNVLTTTGMPNTDFHVDMGEEHSVDLQRYEQDPFADTDLPVHLDDVPEKNR